MIRKVSASSPAVYSRGLSFLCHKDQGAGAVDGGGFPSAQRPGVAASIA